MSIETNIKNRHEQIRRDDDKYKISSVGLRDIDESVKYFFDELVKPKIINDDNTVQNVPILFSFPEQWKTRLDLRDKEGKLQLPLITFHRRSLEKRDDLAKLNYKKLDPENRVHFQVKNIKANYYDNFSKLTNSKPIYEIYSTAIPDFIRVPYEIIIWTEYTDQLSNLVSRIEYQEGQAVGDKHKFIFVVDDYSFDTANEIGQDRMVKCTVDAHVNAYIIPEDIGVLQNIQKRFSTRTILITTEVVLNIDDIQRIIHNRNTTVAPRTGDDIVIVYRLITEDSVYYITTEDIDYITTEGTL